MSFNICFLDNFDCSSKNICCTFYVKVNDIAFPGDQWNDLSFAVLRMWCEILIEKAINRTSSTFELPFMDGPYFIECKNNQGIVKMLFIHGTPFIQDKNRVVNNEIAIRTNELIASIYQASRILIDLAEQQDYGQIRDVIKLKQLIKELEVIES